MIDWQDSRWDENEEYPGQRFGFSGWGPTRPDIKDFYDETDSRRRREIGKRLSDEDD